MDQSTCRWPGCDRQADGSRGFCVRDYGRARTRGDYDRPWHDWRDTRHNVEDSLCMWPECDRPVAARGFCTRDFRRAQGEGNYADPWTTWRDKRHRAPGTVCRWPGCASADVDARTLCRRHYQRAVAVEDFEAPWDLWKAASTCVGCGDVFQARIRDAQYCSVRCRERAWNAANPDRYLDKSRRRRALLRAATVERFTREDVRLAKGDDCYLCGQRLNFRLKWPHPRSVSLDHVVPLSAGGSHTLDNVAFVCLVCNQRKNARLVNAAPAQTLFAV